MRFVTKTIHAWLDYPVALALIVLPFLLGLGASHPLAQAISPVVGVAAFVLSVFTDHHLGLVRVLPYRLHLAIRDRRLVFDVATEAQEKAAEFHLSLTPFNQVVKDYFQICESYFDAVKRLPPSQIEAIDMGRRGIHNEGSRILLDRLSGKVDTDMATARRLFTLICVLHFKA